MSPCIIKPTIGICKNRGADQLHSICKADQRLCFRYRIVQFLFFLNIKFTASSHLLCLYSLVCVGPVGNPEEFLHCGLYVNGRNHTNVLLTFFEVCRLLTAPSFLLHRCLNASSTYTQSFKILAFFCGCTGIFVSDLVRNPKAQFSRDG